MEVTALSKSSSVFFEYDRTYYSSAVRRAFYPSNAKLSNYQFPIWRLGFPSPSWVVTEWSCKAGLGDENAYLEELSFRYRGSNLSNCRKRMCKAFGRAQALPNDLRSASTGVENFVSAEELSLEDGRSSAASSEGMGEQKGSTKELGQELLADEIENEGFHLSSVEISKSGANITQRDVSVASLRIPSRTDEATWKNPSAPTGVENSTSAKELSLEDERSSAASSEGMGEQKVSTEELGQELLAGEIKNEDLHASSVEISESGANITQRDVSVASLRIPSGTDEATGNSTPPISYSSSQLESVSSSSDSISSEDESWLILSGDTLTMSTTAPLTQRYGPHKLFELLSKLELPEIPSPQATLEQLRQSVMFWKSWGRKEDEEVKDEIAPLLGTAAFETRTGVSQLHQWTATELALQHKQLRRVARDVLYLMIACWWVGMVRVAEAVVAAFSSNPPVYSKLWEAMNALDMFTIAWLAYSLRKPIVAILQVDPINLQQVVRLKAHIWQHMHNFYERQWKVVATLAMGRMLGLVAMTLPSSGTITKNVKICWDMLLALPIF